MTDITLKPIRSGYNLSKINNNFETIEEVINDEVLHTEGGNNTMSQQLDMNANKLLNVGYPTSGSDGANKNYVDDTVLDQTNEINYLKDRVTVVEDELVVVDERIDSLEANVQNGFVVKGSFESGFKYELYGDVGIYDDGLGNPDSATTWIYVGSGKPKKTVLAGTNPNLLPSDYLQVSVSGATEATKAVLKGLGYSGNYGFFASGFSYVQEGDLGFDTNNDAYIYIGSGAPSKVVPAGTNPSLLDTDYRKITFINLEIDDTTLFSSLSLDSGGFVVTRNYSPVNSGGSARYKVYTLAEYRDVISDLVWTADNVMNFDLQNGNVAVYESEFGHVTLAQLGVVGDGSDETAAIDLALDSFNKSPLIKLSCIYNRTYKYNGAGLKLYSYKTVFGNLANWTTDTGSLLFLTEGTYDNHSRGVEFNKIKTTGFDDPIQLLFSDYSKLVKCESYDAGNIGMQVKGDELVGNVFEDCLVDGAVFHCFATNDSVNFNPANTDQGRRYPTETTFKNCTALNASMLAYNVHANSQGGISRVYGGRIKNCKLIMKNSYGNQIWKDVDILKEASVDDGGGWLFQAGAGSPTSNPDAYAQISGGRISLAKSESVFLISGNSDIRGIDFSYTGAADAEMQLFQLANQDEIKTVRIKDNTFKGSRMKWNFGALLNDANSAGVSEGFEFTGNVFENGLSLNDSSDSLFKFASGNYKVINIRDNNFNIHSSSVTAALATFAGTVADTVRISGNTTGERNLVIAASSTTLVGSLFVQDNFGVRLDSRNPTRFKNVFLDNNMPRNTSLESVSGNALSPSTLVNDFDFGVEYKVYVSTDLSSSTGAFLNKVEYSIITSRDGLSILFGSSGVVGDEADIGLVFTIDGTDIKYYAATAGTYYINVKKVNQR